MKPRQILAALSWIFFPAAWPAAAQVNAQLLQHWSYDRNLPLDVRPLGADERNGAKVVDLEYASPRADRAKAVGPNGGKVAAYLVLPKGKGPFPAIVYGHWCMPGSEKKNRTEFLEEALLLAQSGVISLLPDHVSVRPEFAEDHTPFNENQAAVIVQQVVNLRRGADLLLARGDVDANRMAYVGHSCDAGAGGFLSGVDKRFRAFVLMAGDLSDEVDKKSKNFEQYRQKVGASRLDAFLQEHAWLDTGKYISQAAPAVLFLQFASDEPFLDEQMERGYCEVASEPKRCKIYKAQHALSPEATRDRILFLSDTLSFQAPAAAAVDQIPALRQPPWPKE